MSKREQPATLAERAAARVALCRNIGGQTVYVSGYGLVRVPLTKNEKELIRGTLSA